MKNLLKFLIITLFLGTSFSALADDGEVIIEESLLSKAEVIEGQKTFIKVKNVTFELEAIPDKLKMQESLQSNADSSQVDPLEAYENMNPEDKVKFLQTRMIFLEQVAKVLNQTKFALGAGSLVGSSFKFIKQKSLQIFGKEFPADQQQKSRVFKQRSHQSAQAVLQALDYKLWSQAPMLIEANEFGISVALGALIEGGFRKTGGGGIEELGLSFAYNKTQKAFVFEIYHTSEKFESSRPLVAALGVTGKAGIHFGNRSGVKSLKGTSHYPAFFPGFSTTTSDHFLVGIEAGLTTPLAGLMTYQNTIERTNLLRITVSPLVKGFVRIQAGDLTRPFVLVVLRVVDVYKNIEHLVKYRGRMSCRHVFAGS